MLTDSEQLFDKTLHKSDSLIKNNLTGIYVFRVNNKDIRTKLDVFTTNDKANRAISINEWKYHLFPFAPLKFIKCSKNMAEELYICQLHDTL